EKSGVLDALKRLTRHPDARVRLQTILAIGRVGPEAIAWLTTSSAERSSTGVENDEFVLYARNLIQQQLGREQPAHLPADERINGWLKAGGSNSIAPLTKLLAGGEMPGSRLPAVFEFLGKQGDAAAVDAIAQFIVAHPSSSPGERASGLRA